MKINMFLNKKLVKNKFIEEGICEYVKRTSKFIKINLYYALDKCLVLDKSSFNINVCFKGKYISSEDLSLIINKCCINRVKNINIVFDYEDNLIKEDICFLNFEVSNGYIYIMVLEQIYRSFKIINNEPYHK